jgi:hypothetical protein
MSLLDVSLVHTREVPTRPVIEGVTEGRRPVTPVLLSRQIMARPTLGGGVAGPGGTPHGLIAVACA